MSASPPEGLGRRIVTIQSKFVKGIPKCPLWVISGHRRGTRYVYYIGLAPLCGFAGRAVKMFFHALGVGLGRMHGSIPMFGRAVERVEAQRLFACVDDVVAGARWHEDCIITFDLRTLAVDQDFALALFDAKELVAIFVDFLANVLARL